MIPTYVDLPTGADLLAFVGEEDEGVTAMADTHVLHVTRIARRYTRGVGFHDVLDICTDDLAAVIVSAASRSMNNPTNATRVELGGYSEVLPQFQGWTLAELDVLNYYRRRTA